MYEMHIAPDDSSGLLVWHVIAKEAVSSLCGQSVDRGADGVRTDRHCLPCMRSFQDLMGAQTDSSAGLSDGLTA
ncbi:hypothetical protein [Streptomyces gardneri]|uniref:Uncharacterized protein n=1 Tax=Streptomyces gardneri TaxID=66892 RepID=A0A4Y3RQ73_9ACTN|nr:hypothetical protein [Streptomyces gardneri]ALO11870.1 hypothetical protein AQF52_6277 [Streptomyces venezuelae]QPK48726.1 hypothetical protein H4W23_31525 [Streptomyces gardneri]WRK40206.1 hypothetical protein U0M97_31680 [Streptomyces venezuelae]CUM37573.1 hypothetical protein BN2537_4111 [Streptomyces venezuelae]GEB58020.1 hypothetical protein SGA01_36250 [Streptomyces gardneri]